MFRRTPPTDRRSLSLLRRPVHRCLLVLGCLAGLASPAGAQPQTVEFFGGTYAASDVVFVVDTTFISASSIPFATMLQQVESAISLLDPDQSFGIVQVGSTDGSPPEVVFPVLVPATPANRATAAGYVGSLLQGGVGCLGDGISSAFQLLEDSGSSVDLATPLVLVAGSGWLCSGEVSEWIAQLVAENRGGAQFRVADLQGTFGALQQLEFYLTPEQAISDSIRGDANGDGTVDIADVIRILQLGFGLSTAPACRDALDVAADGVIEPISDAVTLIGALFLNGAPPVPAPFPACGPEPQANGLTCFGGSCP